MHEHCVRTTLSVQSRSYFNALLCCVWMVASVHLCCISGEGGEASEDGEGGEASEDGEGGEGGIDM